MSRTQYTIIGIHGHAGVGKDTLAAALYDECYEEGSGVSIPHFAEYIKWIAGAVFGIDPDSRETKEIKDEFWNKSPREIQQLIGTECFRKVFGDDFWLKVMERRMQEEELLAGERCIFIIPDVRFQNEADWIIESGGVIIHLTRPGFTGNVGVPNHASEAGIDLSNYSHTEVMKCVNSSTIDSLVSLVYPFVSSYISSKGH